MTTLFWAGDGRTLPLRTIAGPFRRLSRGEDGMGADYRWFGEAA